VIALARSAHAADIRRSAARQIVFVLTAGVVAAVGVIASPASATVVELGKTTGEALPFCAQEPCLAITGVTAFQASVAGQANPMVVPFAGQLASFSVALAKPAPNQIKFFDDLFGPPAVRLAVLEPAGKRGRYRIAAESRLFQLGGLLGTTDQFAIAPIDVAAGDLAALAIPSWLPALSPGNPGDTWRAARKDCAAAPNGLRPQKVGAEFTIDCRYDARLLYTVTLVSGNSRPAIPRFSIRYTIGSRSGGSKVLVSLTISGLPAGAHGRVICRGSCSRLAIGPARTVERRANLEFPNLNLLIAHPIVLELRVSHGRALGRFERVRVGPAGVGFLSSGCLLPDAPKDQPRGYVKC
jgi:hypothetical protein